jgi:2-oxoisovalerate dehydrogenase E1 component
VLTNIRGVKVAYPSTGADLKGLIKSAYYDPNPVVIFEHKGLYWSKIKGTEDAKTVEPDEDYIIPFGKGRKVIEANHEFVKSGESLAVITYGMGVYWSKTAAAAFPGQVTIVDLRTLFPLDEKLVLETVRSHSRCLVVTEEPVGNSFAQALAGKISASCFKSLDAPVEVIGSENLPAIPLNALLEATMIPNAEKVREAMRKVLSF